MRTFRKIATALLCVIIFSSAFADRADARETGKAQPNGSSLNALLPDSWCLVYRRTDVADYVAILKEYSTATSYELTVDYPVASASPLPEIAVEASSPAKMMFMPELLRRLDQASAKPMVFLMPKNASEYLKCLKAAQCLKDDYGIHARITMEATMGAFRLQAQIPLAEDDTVTDVFEYTDSKGTTMYCELETVGTDDGGSVSEVMSLALDRIPGMRHRSTHKLTRKDIAMGCLWQYLILRGEIKTSLLLAKMPYITDIAVLDNKAGITLNLLDLPDHDALNPLHIPCRQMTSNIGDLHGKSLTLLIDLEGVGKIESLFGLKDFPKGVTSIGWEVDADMIFSIAIQRNGKLEKYKLADILSY